MSEARLGRFKVHTFAAEFPMLGGEEFTALVEDIRQNGLLEPVTLLADNETLVDGRNRQAACLEAQVDARYTMLPRSYTEEQIISFIISANLRRRHLNAGQRAFLALKIEELLAVEAKKRQIQGARAGGEVSSTNNSKVKAILPPGSSTRRLRGPESRDTAGKQLGVGGRTVQKAKTVNEKAPDLAKKVKSGEMQIDKAVREAKKREDAQQHNRPDAAPKPPPPAKTTITLVTHKGEAVEYPLPKSKPTFNPANQHISWAAWTWNPVTGCLHGCPYCYAREIAEKTDKSSRQYFPVGFTPLFHRERLDAPQNHPLPNDVETVPGKGRVFVCSMADLYGQWVPDIWIEQVHDVCTKNPQWEYLLLTKFPERYNRVRALPPTAWVGTSVDEQKRVRIAEQAFAKIGNVAVKWLSLEPLREELRFTDLSMFDWVVIGSQTATHQPDGHREPAFAPPFEWVSRLVAQAREAGCKVWLKPNLLGDVHDQSPGMELPQEVPHTTECHRQLSFTEMKGH